MAGCHVTVWQIKVLLPGSTNVCFASIDWTACNTLNESRALYYLTLGENFVYQWLSKKQVLA